MRKAILVLLILVCSVVVFAQQKTTLQADGYEWYKWNSYTKSAYVYGILSAYDSILFLGQHFGLGNDMDLFLYIPKTVGQLVTAVDDFYFQTKTYACPIWLVCMASNGNLPWETFKELYDAVPR